MPGSEQTDPIDPRFGAPAAASPRGGSEQTDPVVPQHHDKLPIDYSTGGSFKAHVAASLANEDDRLAIIEKFHPGAYYRPLGLPEGVQKGGIPRAASKPESVLVFPANDKGESDPVHPTKLVAFTPHGLSSTDLADLTSGVARGAAMIGLGALGEAKGGPAGGLAGAAAGDIGMKELGHYLASKWADVPDSRPISKVIGEDLLEGGKDVALLGAGGAAGAGTGYALRAAENKGFGVPLLKNMSRTAKFDAAGKGLPDVAAAAERLGFKPGEPSAIAPLVTESRTVATDISAASRFGRAADRWGALVGEYREKIQKAWETSLAKLGSSETEQAAAGTKAQTGILDRVKQLADHATHYEDLVERDIGHDTMTDAPQLAAMARQKIARAVGPDGEPLATAGQTVPNFLKQVQADLVKYKGQMPFGQMRDLKTEWDSKADWGEVTPDGTPLQYRQAANAIRGDLRDAAGAKGGQTASNYAEAMKATGDKKDTLEMLGRLANLPIAERAHQAIVAGDRNGPTLVNAYKQTVEKTAPGAWEDTVAVRMQQLALDKNGKLDPVKWDGIWGNGPKAYPESVKNIYAPAGSEQRQIWDDLALMGRRQRETGFDIEGSPTARMTQAMERVGRGGASTTVKVLANLGQAARHPAETAKRLFAAPGEMMKEMNADEAMKLYGSPEFRKWLLDGQKTPPLDPKGMGAKIGALVGIAQKNPTLGKPLSKLMDSIQTRLQQASDQASDQGGGDQGGTRTEPGAAPTALDRAKQSARAAGLAPRPSATRGEGSMTGTRG